MSSAAIRLTSGEVSAVSALISLLLLLLLPPGLKDLYSVFPLKTELMYHLHLVGVLSYPGRVLQEGRIFLLQLSVATGPS